MQQETVRRPGRPRDPQVEARDEEVYRLIADGVSSRSALAQATGLDRVTVAQCAQRLRRAGRVKACHGANGAAVWVVDDGTHCP